MISVDFTSRPLMPRASASTSLTLATISPIGDLDAEVVHLVAVVRADDVDEVLADVVHVALHGGDDEPALGRAAADASPCAARGRRRRPSSSRPTAARTAAASGPSRTARRRPSCPPSSTSLTMCERRRGRRPAPRRGRRSRPSRSPSMMRWCRRSSTGQPAAVELLGLRRLDVGEHLEQLLQRVVVVGAPVVDQVEADLALLVGQPVERHDLAGVDDRRVEPGLARTRGGTRC